MTVTTTSVIWIITSVSRKSFDFPTLNTCCVCTTYFFLFFFPCLLLTSLETFTPRKDLKCTMKETYSTFKCLYFFSLLPFDIPKRNAPLSWPGTFRPVMSCIKSFKFRNSFKFWWNLNGTRSMSKVVEIDRTELHSKMQVPVP